MQLKLVKVVTNLFPKIPLSSGQFSDSAVVRNSIVGQCKNFWKLRWDFRLEKCCLQLLPSLVLKQEIVLLISNFWRMFVWRRSFTGMKWCLNETLTMKKSAKNFFLNLMKYSSGWNEVSEWSCWTNCDKFELPGASLRSWVTDAQTQFFSLESAHSLFGNYIKLPGGVWLQNCR